MAETGLEWRWKPWWQLGVQAHGKLEREDTQWSVQACQPHYDHHTAGVGYHATTRLCSLVESISFCGCLFTHPVLTPPPPPNSRSLTSVISLSIIHTSCHVMLLFHFNILFFCSQLPLVAAQFSVLWTECIVSLFTVTCWYLCLQLQHANTVTHNTIEDDQWPANSFRFTLLGFKLRTVLVSGDC